MTQAVVLVAGADPTKGRGGHGTYVRAHARAAKRAGFEPHIFCRGDRTERVETDLGTVHRITNVLPLDRLPWFRFRSAHLMWEAPLMVRAVTAFTASLPAPRLVHGFGVQGWVAAAAARRLRHRGLAVFAIVSAYDALIREARAKLRAVHGPVQRLSFAAELAMTGLVAAQLERRGLAGCEVILVNYESVRRDLSARYGVGAKIRKVTYGPESAFLHDGGTARALAPENHPSDGPPLILAVSRHDPRKGMDILIAALARLRAAGIPFRGCLVGSGALLAVHRRLVERLRLSDTVRVEGFVPDPFPYLEEADVFVQPSLEEGSGSLSVLEALHAGTPVVASAVDGIPEDVVHGESAYLTKAGDVDALVAALTTMLGDTDLRRRLARGGHAVFQSRFSADAFAAALGEIYTSLSEGAQTN
jgi:glycosyltransferase involved in cell wall biosynthesis